jgi:PadR family transcriptional regulator PadR
VLGTGGGHGYDLRKDVQEMTGGCVCADTGGTYRVLRRLEEQGFVVSRWTAGEAGPQRREYDLTAEGRALLAHWREHLAERKATIDAVIGGVDEALTAAQDTAGTNSAGRAEQRRKGVDHG